MQTTKYLGMIVSDFLYYPGRRNCGPVMSFIRRDRGQTPADHHTLAIALGPFNRYIHSAYQVSDIDTMAAGSRYLAEARSAPTRPAVAAPAAETIRKAAI
jgi:hypothetical protein